MNSCGADATARATCATAKAAFDSKTAKSGDQADAFNAVFGITTNFASVTALDNQGKPIAGSATGNTGGADAATTAAASTKTAASSTSPAAASSTSSAAASTATAASTTTGGNLQTFSAALGGVTAPAVTQSGAEFRVVDNASFKNLENALVRSCDVQHNKCANAANASGNKGDLTVSACGDQQTQCIAAAQQ